MSVLDSQSRKSEGRVTTIGVVTSTRAEYYLLRPLIKALLGENDFQVLLLVTGTHLSEEFGSTFEAIEADGFAIDARIGIIQAEDSYSGIDQTLAAAIIKFGEYFDRRKLDLLIVLGDRFEMLGVVFAAVSRNIGVAHIHGGETTEGALDELIRHAITKMSYLHFTCSEEYRNRVIQMGEHFSRVFNVGALGLENIRTQQLMNRKALEEELGISIDAPSALLTYHPTTLGSMDARDEIQELIGALELFPEANLIITKANSDFGGSVINSLLGAYSAARKNCVITSNLGAKRYLSLLSEVDVVIGNSSSGILETAPFGVPVVNIGDRQKGRLRSVNIIDCECETQAIAIAMKRAFSVEFREIANKAQSPYGDGFTSRKIVKEIKKALAEGLSPRKVFYDIFNCL